MVYTDQQMCDMTNAETWSRQEVHLDPAGDGVMLSTSDGDTFAIAVYRAGAKDREERIAEARENARRIVACLNACAGVPTVMLEHATDRAGVLGMYDALRDARFMTQGSSDIADRALAAFGCPNQISSDVVGELSDEVSLYDLGGPITTIEGVPVTLCDLQEHASRLLVTGLGVSPSFFKKDPIHATAEQL